MENILNKWGLFDLSVELIESPSKSTWDVNGKYILKRISDVEHLKKSLQLSILLSTEGIPVAAYIPTPDGQITVINEGSQYCLMTKLPGKHIDIYEQPYFAVEMGRELARLHKALVRIESILLCNDNDLLADWRNYIKPGLDEDVPDELSEHAEKWLLRLYTKLPRQLIHRDVHLYNVLFNNECLTGWLDFDLGCRNIRLFDIAYLFGGIILGKQYDTEKVKTWRLICNELLASYCEINPLTNDEHKALPTLMIIIELLFVAFWNNLGNPEQRKQALDLAKWLYCEL